MDNEITIKTNRHWYEILQSYDIPDKILKNQFDWMENPDEYQFFKYRGYYYSLADGFMVVDKNGPFHGWDGAMSDSFFSGVLIKYSNCGDALQVGTYYS